MAEDEIKTHPEDLEVAPDQADDVKGGLLPTEPGSESRGLAVHKSKRASHKGTSGPARGMPHE